MCGQKRNQKRHCTMAKGTSKILPQLAALKTAFVLLLLFVWFTREKLVCRVLEIVHSAVVITSRCSQEEPTAASSDSTPPSAPAPQPQQAACLYRISFHGL